MEKLSVIHQRAQKRKGGANELAKLMPEVSSEKDISGLANKVFLAAMTKKIFQSGFVWRVVENKWPGFEEVFWGFEPAKLELASDEQIERMSQDTRIIRNYTKVKSVRDNAFFVQQMSDKHNGFGQFIADWPSDQITQLWLLLKKEGSRLGGNTGPYFLRDIGKDTFLLTRDIVSYLIGQGLVSRQPNSQRDLKLVQQTFNEWQQQSGLGFAEISRIVACSIGENYLAEH
jgi:3-methyladenine DNA glycosylase Tag